MKEVENLTYGIHSMSEGRLIFKKLKTYPNFTLYFVRLQTLNRRGATAVGEVAVHPRRQAPLVVALRNPRPRWRRPAGPPAGGMSAGRPDKIRLAEFVSFRPGLNPLRSGRGDLSLG